MADAPPPYNTGDTTKQPIPPDGLQAPGYPSQPTPGYPQSTPGYPPQAGPAYPSQSQQPYPYPPQPAPGYPPQHVASQPGYPGQQKGYAPGYPPPGQGYVQQPAPSQMTTTNNTTVVVTQQPTTIAAVMPYVNDYMGLSIFSCLCCCWIIGIFAIVKSSEARTNYNAGNYQQAVASATTARNLSYISICCGIGIIVLIIIVSSV